MKKLIVFCILLIAVNVTAEPAEIKCGSVYSGTIAASGTATEYPALELIRKSGYEGFFSIQPVFTGTGTVKIEYQLSNNGKNWSPTVQIVASAASGTVYPYPDPAAGLNIFSGYQRLVFTETGGSNNVVISGVYRCAQ